jgi:AbrB family looped-hinge helix DNA binding protein
MQYRGRVYSHLFADFLTFADFLGLPYPLTSPASCDQMAKEILGTSKVTYKFQITIPKDVREKFGFKEKDILVFVDENGKLVLAKNVAD